MMCIQIKPNTSLSALILNLGAQQCSKKKKTWPVWSKVWGTKQKEGARLECTNII